jgi:hypothetical protein
LKRIPEFDKLTDEEFISIFNYFGPDAFPDFLRETLTWIYQNFIELSAVHDIEFHFSDGTAEGFAMTLKHWSDNSSIMLNLRYPISKFWLLPFRCVAWTKLQLSYRVLKAYSFKFYIECFEGFLHREVKMFYPG